MIVKSLCIILLIIQCFVQPNRASEYGLQPPNNDDAPLVCPSKEYKLNAETGSCYKLHYNARTWVDAHATCISEDGYLAIVNNKVEADALRLMWLNTPRSVIKGPSTWSASIGFRYWDDHPSWRTILGETLEGAGYARWAPGEPNNEEGREKCGSVSRDANDHGILNDVPCDIPLAFICEMSPKGIFY